MEEGSETSAMLAVVAGDCEADDSCVFIQFLHFPLNWQHRVILNVPTSYLGATPTRKAKDTPPPTTSHIVASLLRSLGTTPYTRPFRVRLAHGQPETDAITSLAMHVIGGIGLRESNRPPT